MHYSVIVFEYIILLGILLFLFFVAFPKFISMDSYKNKMFKVFIIFIILIVFNLALETSKDNFIFQLTPEKKCDGGPYMYSSDPERKELCSKFSEQDLSKYECPAGLYHGRPVWWNGATNGTLSNADWKNDTCNQDNIELQVL